MEHKEKSDDEAIPPTSSSFAHGLDLAIEKAKEQDLVKVVFVDGFKNVLDMWLAVIPIVMAVGTIALVIAEYTPIIQNFRFTIFILFYGYYKFQRQWLHLKH